MPEKDPAPFTPPPVQDKRIKPPGIVPKNAQAWILSLVAFVMVVVIALSGKNPPKERPAAAQPAAATVVDPNAARIQEYRNRIDEQMRKLQLEQAQLARTQQAVGVPPNGSAAYPGQSSLPGPYPRSGDAGSVRTRFAPAEPGAEDNSIRMDEKKREYQSRFASNIALTYRKEPGTAEAPPTPTSAEAMARAMLLYGAAGQTGLPAPAAPPTPAPGGSMPGPARANGPTGTERTAKNREQANGGELSHAEGQRYRLFEGTVLETVLTNRLDGYFSGPINCMVTTNVYSHDGQRLLIPQGTRVLGEVRRVETFGQQRLAVFFHRLIMPDGYSASLDQFHGLNQIGETGLVDQINHHYLQVFGVSLAIGAIAGLGQVNTRSGLDVSAADAYREGVTNSLSQSSLRILDRYLNVLPTFTIREGHRVKVYLSDDLLLPAYEEHRMPTDL